MVTLNKPTAGDTDWATEINDNWTTIENSIDQSICQGRLTLTSDTPITTSDVTAATTVYFTPFRGNRIGIYNGSTWVIHSLAQRSASLSGLSANTNYDVFIYDVSGTLTLELVAWSGNTTRNTALATQDGILVKAGAPTKRYLGTIRITGTTGQCEDSVSKRFVWNYHNRLRRQLRVIDATNSWTYNSTTWRQAGGSSANQVEIVIGVSEDPIQALVYCATEAVGSTCTAGLGVGISSTTVNSATTFGGRNSAGTLPNAAFYRGVPGVGYYYVAWLEATNGGTGVTYFGDNNVTQMQSGMTVEIPG